VHPNQTGTHVAAETAQRLACDATRVVMRHDAHGRITEVGARTRTIPPALWRALQHRDQGCRFPAVADDSVDGRPFPDVPPTPAVPAAPCEELRAQQQALAIDARTSMPGWLAERLDVGYAISVLHPLAIASP
jgi:hypothetical protein